MEIRSDLNRKDMAHKADMPESFYFVKNQNGDVVSGLFKIVNDVGESTGRKEKVFNLARVFYELEAYKKNCGFSKDQVDIQREKKALARGRFKKRIIQTDENGNSKLVRDKLYEQVSFNNHSYEYRTAKNEEFPRFLNEKLNEEVNELYEVLNLTNDKGEKLDSAELRVRQLEELSDVEEVLDEILYINNINMEDINSKVYTWQTVGKITGNPNSNSGKIN